MLRRIFRPVTMAVIYGLVLYIINTLSGDMNRSVSASTNLIESALAFGGGFFVGSDD